MQALLVAGNHIVILLSLVAFLFGAGFSLESEAALTPICALQGSGFVTPYEGQSISTRGVVFADMDSTWVRGFYIQQANCDGLETTSDGIFIYIGEKIDVVQPGDFIEVSGVVQEYYGMTEIASSTAQIAILARYQTLPPVAQLDPPVDDTASRVYFEAREGMRAGLAEGLVVGPTNYDERSWLVQPHHGITHVFGDNPAGTGELICVDDAGSYDISPQVKVGDTITQIQGVLDYRYATYCLQLTAPPVVQTAPFPVFQVSEEDALSVGSEIRGGLKLNSASEIPGEIALSFTPEIPETLPSFRLGTYNLANLFDTLDDPLTDDSVLSATEYQRRLEKHALGLHNVLQEPDLLAVQEAENARVLQDLLARPEIQSTYGFSIVDGPDKRGIDVAFLYRTDRVQVETAQARQGCTTLVDGLGPDGNLDVYNPANAITCDTNNDGIPDGNRLFSRPPLLAKVKVCHPSCPSTEGEIFWLINNHLKSKTEDTSSVAYTLPRRIAQAQFLAGLVGEIMSGDSWANIILLGDLNDTPASQPLSILKGIGLVEALERLDRELRYTYIYNGITQTLDYALYNLPGNWSVVGVQPLHFNADFPVDMMSLPGVYWRSSDHDPLVVTLMPVAGRVYLPVVRR